MSLLAVSPRRSFGPLLAAILLSNALYGHPIGGDSFSADLKSSKVLGALQFDEVEPERGLVLSIEVLAGADADRVDQIGEELTAVFTEVETRFDQRFGALGERAEIRVVVVQSFDTWQATRAPGAAPSPPGARFAPQLGPHGAVVTYDLAWPGSSRRVRLLGLHEALAQALIASHAEAAPTTLPGALLAGLGRRIALDDGATAGILARRVDPSAAPTVHERLIAQLVEGGFADGFLTDSGSLFAPQGLDGLWADARARTREARETDAWAERRFESLVDQAAHHFAVGLEDETTRDSLYAWLASTLAGEGNGTTEPLIAAEGLAWSQLLTTEHTADLGFDPRGLGGPEPFQLAVNALNLPAPDPDAAATSGRPEDRLAESLWLAATGHLEEAQEALAMAGDEDVIRRHRASLEALATLRANYLAHLADGAVTEMLRIDYEGKLLVADVTRVGRRSVFLGENSRDLTSLPIASIDIGELVGRMEKEKPPFGDSTARAWAQALVGGKWQRSLDLPQKKDKVLQSDLSAVEGQLERGRILTQLAVVEDAATSNPDKRLAAIADLLATAADSDEVANARGHLEEVARALLTDRFQSADMTALLSAASIERDGDQLKLKYDFMNKAQLSDWPEVAGYAPDFVAQFAELETKSASRELDDDMLLVQGAIVFQHLLAFEGPVKLSYEMSYERTKTKSEAKLTALDYVYASICDDLNFQHLRTSQFGNLDVVDSEKELNVQQVRETPLTYKLGATYRLELELDAKGKATTRLDGEEVFSIEDHGRVSGRVLFMIRSDRVVRLHEVTIEGRLANDQAPLVAMWLEGQLDEIGF